MAAPALTFLFCILLLSKDSAQTKRMLPGSAVVAEDGAVSKKRLLGRAVDASVSWQPGELVGGERMTVRDVFAPVTNPVTVPATNPASNPGGIVTVPSTNPGTGTGFATNPNLPPLYPEPTTPVTTPDPTTMPAPVMNPVTAPTMPAPFTNPTAPVTNPATTPTPIPGTSPVTNPATTYPYPPQGGGVGGGFGMTPTAPAFPPPTTMPGTVVQPAAPAFPPPTTMPGTVVQPAAPATAGQTTWCVAKAGLMETVLQNGLDYACGIGGADCSALQPMGSCYNPNTLQAHASYAFNSYFQRSPSAASCDFGGAGMLVSTNPSSGTCMYQTSAGSGAGYSPAVTGTGPAGMTPGYVPAGMTPGYGPVGTTPGYGPAVSGGSGSTVLNANNPGGTSMYGPDNPTGLTAGAASLSCGWVLSLIWIFTFAYVKEKV